MEKQANFQNMSAGSCDSMTTVAMKDYSQVDYPDPPPSYKTSGPKSTELVQMSKIVAVTAIIICSMISFAVIISAWITSSSSNSQICQYQTQPSIESLLLPQSLISPIPIPGSREELESAESKAESSKRTSETEKKASASSEEDDSRGDVERDDEITMFKLPLELNLHEHLFEKSQRSHMNCVVEKKKAEEIVDEQSKPLPLFLGINISTDPRYLHFTGEKMAISCDSAKNHRRPPPPMEMFHHPPPPPPHHPLRQFLPPHHPYTRILPAPAPMSHSHLFPLQTSGSANLPLHIIGPIPLGPWTHGTSGPGTDNLMENSAPQMIPIVLSDNTLSIEDIAPIIIPSNSGESQSSYEMSPQFHIPRPLAEFQFRQAVTPEQNPNVRENPLTMQGSEIRERALHNPIPIVPRPHFEHVIRPRSVENEKTPSRMKRCACDCACKSHQN